MRNSTRTPVLRQPRLRENLCAETRSTLLNDHLRRLIEPISRGDQDAFGSLFDQTCGQVLTHVKSWRLQHPPLGALVFAATYVEVWWLAGCHTGPDADVPGWIHQTVDRRVAEALRRATPRSPSGEAAPADAVVPRARRAAVELAQLLGRPVDAWLPSELAAEPQRMA